MPRIQARRFHRCGPTTATNTSPTTLWIAIDTGSNSTDSTPATISATSTAQRTALALLTRSPWLSAASRTSAGGAILRLRPQDDGGPAALPRAEPGRGSGCQLC